MSQQPIIKSKSLIITVACKEMVSTECFNSVLNVAVKCTTSKQSRHTLFLQLQILLLFLSPLVAIAPLFLRSLPIFSDTNIVQGPRVYQVTT